MQLYSTVKCQVEKDQPQLELLSKRIQKQPVRYFGEKNKSYDNLVPTAGFANPQIMKINVDRRKLTDIINKFDQWKQEYSQILQRYDVKLQHSRDKQAMLNSEQVSSMFLSIRYTNQWTILINKFNFRLKKFYSPAAIFPQKMINRLFRYCLILSTFWIYSYKKKNSKMLDNNCLSSCTLTYSHKCIAYFINRNILF
jgi:hypothetical protein